MNFITISLTLLYNLVISIYHFGIRVAALTNPKAAKWVAGRKNLLARMREEVDATERPIWMHCASLGEFEQGRPIIERLKQRNPNVKVLLTFFSPSGYEVRQDYEHASYVYYLPRDSKSNARTFLEIVKPRVAIFVKYEYWLNYLSALKAAKVPTYLISARLRKDQVFFKSYGGVFRRALGGMTRIFLQDQVSNELAKSLGLQNTEVGGDTRYDRVSETVENAGDVQGLNAFVGEEQVFIGGSTWPVDEAFILPFINAASAKFKFILAPHVVDDKHIDEIERNLDVACIRYSNIESGDVEAARVLIIDNVGMLSNLYKYGHIAYVGGGFTGALHNILEPAAFGMPVLFGPRFDKFPEAEELIEAGGAFAIIDGLDFVKRMSFLSDPFVIKIAAEMSRKFVRDQVGAADKVVEAIQLEL
ncbi:3-deoxy-D-manno-octulosonic acid transferase [Flavobacteriales bacterium AH-315-E23]|nr:3-deoxy-D-manno-octulosonic acid transferase [Flavobacteriales bacterium AH-315-E23]